MGQYCDGSHGCPGGFCVQDPVTGSRFCTVACDLENDTCPAGMACSPTGSTPVCGPRHDDANGQETHSANVDLTVGACNLGLGAGGGPAPLPLLVLGLLLLVRRFTRP